ncbi:MAG: hypothetical protein ACI4MH_01030, partial [Candidatus Coproplasma sp.]
MLYDEYRRKVIKFADILKILKRFRVLIFSVLAAIIGVAAVLLTIDGIVYDEGCPSVIGYGQELDFKAGAVMNSVRYEYSTGDGQWSEEPPLRAGDYLVRAVSKNVFGGDRYGNEYAFTILPKEINVQIDQSSIRYGDALTVSAQLEYSDSITCNNYIYEDISARSTSVIPDMDGIVITDKNGNDVTSSYSINLSPAIIDFEQRKIDITVNDKSGVYDGQPLSFDGYELSADTPLAENDSIVAVFSESITEAGEIENVPEIKIFRDTESGQIEVTGNYLINLTAGTLTVEKRPVYIRTGDAVKYYDGEELSSTEFGLVSDYTLVSGHRLEVVSATAAITCGEVENVLTFKVLDADGNDMSANYSLFLETGKLTINKRPVTISSASAQWVYDGDAHSNGEHLEVVYENTDLGVSVEDYGLLQGHITQYSSLTEIISAGSAENVISIQIFDGETEATSNYDISYVFGTLEITPRPITLSTADDSWVYDGTAHGDGAHSVVDGEYGLVEGHETDTVELTLITDVGTAENVISVAVYDGETEVTQNYSITYQNGTLEVTLRPVTVTTASNSWVYDGTAHSDGGHTVSDEYTLAEGHSTQSENLTQITDVGTAENIFTVRVYDGETEVTQNYTVSYEYGTLEITPRPVIVSTASNSWVYDGTAHSDGSHTVADGEYSLVEGHQTKSSDLAQITDVGTTENIMTVAVYDGETEVTQNYAITYQYGTLEITPRPVTIITSDNSWVYDGEAHSDGAHSVADGEYVLVEGHSTRVVELTQITNVGTEENVLTVVVYDGETEVTQNYTITYQNGTLQITPRPVTVSTASNSWVYDGTAHSDVTHSVAEGEYVLVEGHSTRVIELTNITNVGTIENALVVVVYDGETEVTLNYTITYQNGTLQITPRPVTVTTESFSWVYDGTAHSYGAHSVIDDEYSLIDGHYTQSENLAQITDVGTADNVLTVRVFFGATEVTGNYEIDYIYGTLEITARPVIIASADYQWIYDGEPHSCGDHSVVSDGYTELGVQEENYGLVSGHTTTSYDLTQITVVQTVDNVLKVKIFNGTDEVTANYEISYKYGKLTVNPRPITVTAGDASKVYDGAALTCGDYFVSSELKVLDGHTLTAQTEGSQTDAGSGVNSIVEGSVKITDSNGEDITGYYEISFGDGTLTVTPRPIVIETSSNSW